MVRLTFMAHLQLGSPRCQNRRRRIRVFWSFPCCVTEPFSASSNKPRHLSLFATVAPHPENGSLERAAIARVNSKISEESATCLWAPHSKIRHDKTFWGLWCPKASPKQMKHQANVGVDWVFVQVQAREKLGYKSSSSSGIYQVPCLLNPLSGTQT